MDYATIQARISRGYGIAGRKLGPVRDIFRPIPPQPPLAVANKIGSTPVALDATPSFGFNKPNEYGDARWYALVDTSLVQAGDYLVYGSSIHFLAAVQPLLPAMAIECNTVVALRRPRGPAGNGAQPYGGAMAEVEDEILSAWPASLLLFGMSRRNDARISGEALATGYRCLLPPILGVNIRDNDILVNTDGVRYQVQGAELSDLGWRLNLRLAST